MYYLPDYVAHIADPAVASILVETVRDKASGFTRYWALTALLAGWGRNHRMVKSAIEALSDASDEDLEGLASLLPEIYPDRTSARARLIRMATRETLRRDLLVAGLAACGCDAADNDAVAAILAFPEKLRGSFEPSSLTFRAFGAHVDVRALARERLREVDAPLAAIALGYADDREFAPTLFDAAVPLPVDLRTQIIEFSAIGAAGTALEATLGEGMLEADPELRARMVVAHSGALPPEARNTARDALLARAVAVGPDYESVRAAALAGLVTIGALDALATLDDRGSPVRLVTGSLLGGIASVERVLCERFSELETAFGGSLEDRFERLGDRTRFAEILSAAPDASPAARKAFLALADRGQIPRTPRALRALAAERPHSDLLLARCWDALGSHDHRNDRAMLNADIGLILRDNFGGDAGVRQRLVERFRSAPSIATAIPLAIFAPDADELPFPVSPGALGREFADWAMAVHVAAYRADSAAFCALIEAMVTRQLHSRFDAQHITNRAIEGRLQCDSDLVDLLSARIGRDINPSTSGSFARYLAAAGKLRSEERGKVMDILAAFGTEQRLPVAGYDAIADQWRAVRATLLDAVSAGLELS